MLRHLLEVEVAVAVLVEAAETLIGPGVRISAGLSRPWAPPAARSAGLTGDPPSRILRSLEQGLSIPPRADWPDHADDLPPFIPELVESGDEVPASAFFDVHPREEGVLPLDARLV